MKNYSRSAALKIENKKTRCEILFQTVKKDNLVPTIVTSCCLHQGGHGDSLSELARRQRANHKLACSWRLPATNAKGAKRISHGASRQQINNWSVR